MERDGEGGASEQARSRRWTDNGSLHAQSRDCCARLVQCFRKRRFSLKGTLAFATHQGTSNVSRPLTPAKSSRDKAPIIASRAKNTREPAVPRKAPRKG